MDKLKIYYRNRLPHIVPVGAIVFVTFRLYGSLPEAVIENLREKRHAKEREIRSNPRLNEKVRSLELVKAYTEYFEAFDDVLDKQQYGESYLADPEIASIMQDKLHQFDNDKYYLLAYCIMPNHVHMLIDLSCQLNRDPLEKELQNYVQLHGIMKLIKGGSAYLINQKLKRHGKVLWQKDSYDRYMRNQNHLAYTINYILNNPVKAGLVEKCEDYKFSYLRDGIINQL